MPLNVRLGSSSVSSTRRARSSGPSAWTGWTAWPGSAGPRRRRRSAGGPRPAQWRSPGSAGLARHSGRAGPGRRGGNGRGSGAGRGRSSGAGRVPADRSSRCPAEQAELTPRGQHYGRWRPGRGAADRLSVSSIRQRLTRRRDCPPGPPLAGPVTGPQLGARGGWSWETYGIARYPVCPAADLVPHDLSNVK